VLTVSVAALITTSCPADQADSTVL
jgi:hypothetical protein